MVIKMWMWVVLNVFYDEAKTLHDCVRVETPASCTPELLVSSLRTLVRDLPPFDRVSVGFPGVVRKGVVITVLYLGMECFKVFDLEHELEKALNKPVRVLN